MAATYDRFDLIEDTDDGIFAIRAEARERKRAIARVQQRALAEQLSRATAEEYEDDILAHMERMETETLPDVSAIDIQVEIQWYMRPYLLDFLIEAHSAFQLLPDTLFLAVNILDRYCSRRIVYKRHYQLVGCAALLIASKYGDKKDRVPTINELRNMCCGLYDDDMFTQMEWHVLQTLNWVIGHPTIDAFLQMATSETAYDPAVEHMTWFLCELALYHRDFVDARPSVLARSALALARCILGRPQARHGEWAASYDSMTVLKLSNFIGTPSQILDKKYASMHLSGASVTVQEFLRYQAEIAARQTSPVTPSIGSPEDARVETYLEPQTPQKGPQYNSVMQHGYMTPPITPDAFHDSNTYGNCPTLSHVFPSTPLSTNSITHPLQQHEHCLPVTYALGVTQ